MYEDSENVNAARVNTVVFNLLQINVGLFFWTPSISFESLQSGEKIYNLFSERVNFAILRGRFGILQN